MSDAPASLVTGLLRGDTGSVDPAPKGRLGRTWRIFLAVAGSLFVAYHTVILLVWNTPSGGVARHFHGPILDALKGRPYFSSTSNTQSWAMFAPNPNRTNVFIRVLVTDENGDTYDLKHDIWEVDRFPYLFYDRMGKINRRIDGKSSYQRIYGAWVCREWEREHGSLPKSVQFVKLWTVVPTPEQSRHLGWSWDPWLLPSKQKEQDKIDCKTTVHAQLPPELRERFGMEPAEEGHFRDVRPTTWWTKLEQERKRLERRRELGLDADGAPVEEVEPADPSGALDM